MNHYFSLLFMITLSSLSNAYSKTDQSKIIYGKDNRKDIFETTYSPFVEMAKSTAAMIKESQLEPLRNQRISIDGMILKNKGVCETERFSKQLSASKCSGFLVAPDKLVTAGHCVKDEEDCKNYRWVFDFKADQADQTNFVLPQSNVYACKKIIARKKNKLMPNDYALIELDLKVTDRLPLKIRQSGNLQANDELVIIGHPSGLPTKIADGAYLIVRYLTYFMANLDSFGGNSGSPVINVRTEEVEGILTNGENDYVYDTDKNCLVTKYCKDKDKKCLGETVIYIKNIPGIFLLN